MAKEDEARLARQASLTSLCSPEVGAKELGVAALKERRDEGALVLELVLKGEDLALGHTGTTMAGMAHWREGRRRGGEGEEVELG